MVIAVKPTHENATSHWVVCNKRSLLHTKCILKPSIVRSTAHTCTEALPLFSRDNQVNGVSQSENNLVLCMLGKQGEKALCSGPCPWSLYPFFIKSAFGRNQGSEMSLSFPVLISSACTYLATESCSCLHDLGLVDPLGFYLSPSGTVKGRCTPAEPGGETLNVWTSSRTSHSLSLYTVNEESKLQFPPKEIHLEWQDIGLWNFDCTELLHKVPEIQRQITSLAELVPVLWHQTPWVPCGTQNLLPDPKAWDWTRATSVRMNRKPVTCKGPK